MQMTAPPYACYPFGKGSIQNGSCVNPPLLPPVIDADGHLFDAETGGGKAIQDLDEAAHGSGFRSGELDGGGGIGLA